MEKVLFAMRFTTTVNANEPALAGAGSDGA